MLNRTTSTQSSEATPYEKWTGKKPSLAHIRIFGSDAYVHISRQQRDKLDPKAKKLVLVGYQGESTNYRLYDPQKKRVSVARDIIFNERTNCSNPEKSTDSLIKLPDQKREHVEDEDKGQRPEARAVPEIVTSNEEDESSDGTYHSPDRGSRQLRDRNQIKRPARYEVNLAECNEPISYRDAISRSDAEKWIKAIAEELSAHEKNGTWTIVPQEPGQNPIDSRGFMQKPGRDYSETFSPVIRFDSLRVFLAMVAQRNLELIQFDVKTAFLYGKLPDRAFMKIPEGLHVKENETLMCKLEKALYGLKQASRIWNREFVSFLKHFSFTENNADKCIFHGKVDNDDVYLGLYVDDGLIAAKSNRSITKVTNALKEMFEITLGNAEMFVGLQINRDRSNKQMFLSQRNYTEQVLSKFEMNDAKEVAVPADPHASLQPVGNNVQLKCNVPYRETVGSLMFLASVSRPDIAFAVSYVSRFLNGYGNSHWQAIKRILRYLKGTLEVEILYNSEKNDLRLVGYSDADFASDVSTRRSTTGVVFMFAGGPVTWSSQRQSLVTLSTTESEYVAATSTAKEAMWLRSLLNDLGYSCEGATVLNIDNQSTIRLAKNPEFHKRTKHIDLRFHYVREKVEAKEIVVKYVPTGSQLADILTKALPKERFYTICTELQIVTKPTKCSDRGSVVV